MSTIYSGERTPAGATRVYVNHNRRQEPLEHIVRHSADGFEWGYHGSGPRDLARSIVADHLTTTAPDDAYTQAVLDHFVAKLPQRSWSISADAIDQVLRCVTPKDPTDFPLGRVVATREVATQLMVHPLGHAFVKQCLDRHTKNDWGQLSVGDAEANAAAHRSGGRLWSNYQIPNDVTTECAPDASTVWVITEAADDDGRRCQTTVLYPSDY